ncbi:MAG: DUF1573 domain-containing protein [Gemmataceae bacterium]
MFRHSLVLLATLWLAASASASTWADALFDELSKDFGSVPRGPTLTHHFRLVNKTQGPISISNVRVSCGCTTATAVKTYLKPGEETSILAQMDTTRFHGTKTVTIFVQFNAPSFDEARLWVQAISRSDFTLTPDTFALGQVKRGTAPVSTVRMTFYGNPGARIVGIKGESNYLIPEFRETRRADQEVVYDLTVQLREDTPVGKWYTDVWVKTSLPTLPAVRVPLTVEVESPLTVSPSVVNLGPVRLAGESERRILVRGVKPFRITGVKGADDVLDVSFAKGQPREVHVMTVKVRPDHAGNLDRTLRVVTDLPADNEIDFRIQATALPN